MKTSEEFINKFCTQHKQGTVKVTLVNQEAVWDNIPSQEFLDWLDTKVSRVERKKQKIGEAKCQTLK
jgi:hypothetical protein